MDRLDADVRNGQAFLQTERAGEVAWVRVQAERIGAQQGTSVARLPSVAREE